MLTQYSNPFVIESRAVLLFGLLVLMGVAALPSQAAYSSLYMFGDSLSAVSGGGTQYAPPPGTSVDNYFQGRFSNGRVWIEYLAEQQGIPFDPAHDFSNFGDTASGVYDNIIYGNYFPPPDISTSLYVFWSGCSDCFFLALFYSTNSWTSGISNVMVDVSNVVDVFYSQGVRTILLPNSVDISKVPFFSHTLPKLTGATNDLGASLAAYHNGVEQFNAALAAQIVKCRASHPGLTILAPDFYTQFNFVLSNAGVYGLTEENIDVLEDPVLTDKSFSGPGANYVFWDYLHPTTKVHQYVANFVHQIASPLRIAGFTLAGTSYRFEASNLPLGRTGVLESATDVGVGVTWTARASIVVTASTQTVVVPTNGLPQRCFFRLNFPP